MPHSTSSNIIVEKIVHPEGSKVNFGAFISSVDLNNLSDEDFDAIRKATYENSLVVIKGQRDLIPNKQFELVHRFDPMAAPLHGHGTLETMHKTVGGKRTILAAGTQYEIPGAPGVRLVGFGYQGSDHYGLKDVTQSSHTTTTGHDPPMSIDDVNAGFTRWGRWHIDAALYDREPPMITALRCIKLPKGPDLTVRWDDGTDKSMKVPPGRTAYWSGEQLYDTLSDEEKMMVDNSYVKYAPDPYRWIREAKLSSDGQSIPIGQGKELDITSYPWDPKLCKQYPMAWTNPVTGKKAFQVHAICAMQLIIKKSPDAEEELIDDIDEVRRFLSVFHRRMVTPEHILVAPYEEGDIAVWNNRACMHSFYEYPASYGTRTMHQVNIAASAPPS